jgi:ParB family transcriptional regulator, chromosome partitioning protein
MNAMTTIAKSDPSPARRPKLSISTRATRPSMEAAPARIVPSAPTIFPLRQLRRAAENVRHTRADEDIAELAADIVAHGLLQSLIGYRDGETIQIVGGGRRFQALRLLEDEAAIDGDFQVAVLIRDREDAVELSLAENLQQRTMSPVDEFFAFRALIETGHYDPAELAKRFGFSERVVKQRLRLAELAPEILDALASRQISLDVAMAYARSQDHALQLLVFRAEKKRSHDPHRIRNIEWTLNSKGIRTDNPLFQFVGPEAYERRGGRYEDDLFGDTPGEVRTLATPAIALTAAQELLDFQMVRLLEEARHRDDLAPTIVGYVTPPDLRLQPWGAEKLVAPPGFAKVQKHDCKKMWNVIRNNGIDAHLLAGIDHKGTLIIYPQVAFVPIKQKDAVDPPAPVYGGTAMSPEQMAAAARARGIARIQRDLAVGSFAGTHWEGRARSTGTAYPAVFDGAQGFDVEIKIFVTDEEVAAQRVAAELQYDREAAERVAIEEARQATAQADSARLATIWAMSPEPAVVIVDGEPFFLREDGDYSSEGDIDGFSSLDQLLNVNMPDEIGQAFATVDLYRAAMAAAGGAA